MCGTVYLVLLLCCVLLLNAFIVFVLVGWVGGTPAWGTASVHGYTRAAVVARWMCDVCVSCFVRVCVCVCVLIVGLFLLLAFYVVLFLLSLV